MKHSVRDSNGRFTRKTNNPSILDANTEISRIAKCFDDDFMGWYQKININTLTMLSNTKCILGQVFGAPNDVWWLALKNILDKRYGLNGGEFSNPMHTNAWIYEIKKRQKGSK